jgi:predicted phage-related endonuclease
MLDEINATIEGLKDQIKSHMTERNLDKLTVDVHKINYTLFKTTRIDTISLKKEMLEIANRFSKTSETRRLSIA